MVIHLSGVDLNVIVEGEGPDVLLIHGFPDDHTVWRKQIPALVDAGYRVIAPDTRGRGESSMPGSVEDYRIGRLLGDISGILDAVDARKVRVVAHDWGAVIGWAWCMRHPERVDRYVALSVGHPNAFIQAPIGQKIKSRYILAVQLRGISEWAMRLDNWLLFRLRTGYPDEWPHWIELLSPPGRLTAALNYYRANWRMTSPREYPAVDFPVLGLWSSKDRFLGEQQMIASAAFVRGPWRYEKIEGANHWLQLDAAERFNPLLLEYLAREV